MVKLRHFWAGICLLASLGCISEEAWKTPQSGVPAYLAAEEQNPVYIPQGAFNYAQVFENCLSVLYGYGFEIAESNRADGRIETAPRVAPGLGRPFRAGNPDICFRAMSTLQSYRHRVSIVLQPA